VPGGPDVVLSWRVERSRYYGPLVARGLLRDGTPIAVASLRSTYNGELNSARGFRRINDPSFMAGGYDAFRATMGTGVDYTFNWFFIDSDDIGYEHSCKCPQRAPGVDPYLPAWGDGRYDWRGFIGLDAQPHDLNPAAGYITSWNNKQAPQFKASDREFAFGPTHRSQLLDARIAAAFATGPLDRADVVDIMEDAGTVDLRGQEVLGLLLEAMGTAAPIGSDPRAQEMRDRLAEWLTTQTHRRDHDRSGEYDDPQSPAIIDAWWPLLAHAMFDARSGYAIDNLGLLIHDAPQLHLGSAFNDGVYGQVNKDLRRVLGKPQTAPWSRAYCGGGDLAVCRGALWASLSDAAATLEQEFSSPSVANWKRKIADDDVRHSAVGVVNVPAIHWINRPTFQQVVQIEDPQTLAQAHGAGWLNTANGKKIGFTLKADVMTGGGASGEFKLHDHATGSTIELHEFDATRAPAGAGCGAVPAGGANSIEFTGTATFNGTTGRTVKVFVQDNSDPGQGHDVIHVECGDCPYNTSTAAASEVLGGGNIKVRTPATPPRAAGSPSVVVVEPALGSSAAPGAIQTVTVTVYDAAGNPVAGVPLTLTGPSILSLVPLSPVTNTSGRLTFQLRALLPLTGVWTAQAGGVQSNPVRIVWLP
jgi:hypothetical protein